MGLGLTVFCGNRCNMSCSYCYIKNKTNNNINFDSLKKSLINNTNITTLTLIGGEPLIHNNLIDFLSFVKKENKTRNKNKLITLNIITNGTIYIKELKFYKDIISIMQISIDGGEKTNNSIRKFKDNAYNISVENLIKYYNDGINVSVNSVIYDVNLWKKDVKDLIHVLPKNIIYGLNIEEFNKKNWFSDLYKIFIIINIEKQIQKINKNFVFHFKYFINELSICNAGQGFLSLNLENNKIAPCHIMFEDDIFKNEYIGYMDDHFNIDENKLEQSLSLNNISNYSINYCNSLLNNILLKHILIPICYVNNKIITGDYFKIPLRHVLFYFIINILRGKNV